MGINEVNREETCFHFLFSSKLSISFLSSFLYFLHFQDYSTIWSPSFLSRICSHNGKKNILIFILILSGYWKIWPQNKTANPFCWSKFPNLKALTMWILLNITEPCDILFIHSKPVSNVHLQWEFIRSRAWSSIIEEVEVHPETFSTISSDASESFDQLRKL